MSPALQPESPYSELALVRTINAPGSAKAIALSPDGKTVISGGSEKAIKVWDLETGQLRQTLQSDSGVIEALAFAGNNQTVVSGGGDRQIRLWNLETGEREAIFKADDFQDMGVADDGKMVLTSTWDGMFSAWDLVSREPKSVPSPQKTLTLGPISMTVGSDTVWDIDLSPDGKTVAIADCGLTLHELATGQRQTVSGSHFWDHIQSVDYSADGKRIATTTDRQLQVWSLPAQKRIASIKAASWNERVDDVVLTAAGRYALAIVRKHRPPFTTSFRIWDLQTQNLVAIRNSPTGGQLAVSLDGKTIVHDGGSPSKFGNEMRGAFLISPGSFHSRFR